MKACLKKFLKNVFVLLDPIFALLAILGLSGLIAKRAMVISTKPMALTRMVFAGFGYLPIRDHYYEPLTFGAEGFRKRDKVAQRLFKDQRNFDYLSSIACPDEFGREYDTGALKEAEFRFGNGSFESGDAETLYYFVRGAKPARIIEIGAGNSSRVIHAALKKNAAEGAPGEHVIIEPYENPWLENLGAQVIRERVEMVDFSIFRKLGESDIVFIDSSHVVRAQNDCVFEYTELLPNLPVGVIVHIHDIFTPYDYPDDWLNKKFLLWAEQYVLEALLANSDQWEILAPLCWLSRDADRFKALCPYFEEGRVPGSFWIRKIT